MFTNKQETDCQQTQNQNTFAYSLTSSSDNWNKKSFRGIRDPVDSLYSFHAFIAAKSKIL